MEGGPYLPTPNGAEYFIAFAKNSFPLMVFLIPLSPVFSKGDFKRNSATFLPWGEWGRGMRFWEMMP
jgi:hypothetical protein